MQIEQLNKDLDFALNKASLYFSHEEKMDALHRAQIELFYFYYGNPAGYQPGRPVARTGYQQTQAVASALQPFLKSYDYFGLTNGIADAPADMAFPTALRTTLGKEIRAVDDDKVASHLNSRITPPTDEYPVAEITGSGWQLYPALSGFRLKYLAYPVRPRYATKVVNGELVFDAAASVDIQWNPVQYNELLSRTMAILGLHVKDGVVMQTAERNKQQGN
jgi:hypothetical protein